MAFEVLATYCDVDTGKPGETAKVQHVHVTGRTMDEERIEIRLFVQTESYDGPTKTALTFTDPEEVAKLIKCLTTAKAQLGKGSTKSDPKPTTKRSPAKRATAKKATTTSTRKATATATKAPAKRAARGVAARRTAAK